MMPLKTTGMQGERLNAGEVPPSMTPIQRTRKRDTKKSSQPTRWGLIPDSLRMTSRVLLIHECL